LQEWRHGRVDAAVSVGPLECMPTKIAEAQFHQLAEREGLLSLTLAFNGDPISTTALDNFAFEVKARFQHRRDRANSRTSDRCGGDARRSTESSFVREMVSSGTR
jgi:hypothetical protein